MNCSMYTQQQLLMSSFFPKVKYKTKMDLRANFISRVEGLEAHWLRAQFMVNFWPI